MVNTILNAEQTLNGLLPVARLEEKPSAGLLNAAKDWAEAVWDQAEKLGPMLLSPEQVRQGITLSGNAVFICGVHRSGTTLLRDLLDGHPDLVVLPSEGSYYTNLETKIQALPVHERMAYLCKEWLRRLVNPINQPPYWLLGQKTENYSPYVEFARYFMAWWPVANHKIAKHWPHVTVMLALASVTQKLNAALWVDKTPVNERFINRIWQEFPNAKIVHIIREPYAVVSSRKKMEPTVALTYILKDLSKSFKIAIRQNVLNDVQFKLMRYEEICEDTGSAMEKLAAFLGIENTETLLSPTVLGTPVQANSSFANNSTAGHIIQPDQHKHPEMLSLVEKCLLTARLKWAGKKLGYDLTLRHSWRGHIFRNLFFLNKPVKL